MPLKCLESRTITSYRGPVWGGWEGPQGVKGEGWSEEGEGGGEGGSEGSSARTSSVQ